MKKLSSGELYQAEDNFEISRLGFSCGFSWGWNKTKLKNMHDNMQWKKLADKVYDLGCGNDLAYYYIGRAAEGLGHGDSAIKNYKHSIYLTNDLSRHRTCRARNPKYTESQSKALCSGLSFPKIAKYRLSRMKQKNVVIKNNNNSGWYEKGLKYSNKKVKRSAILDSNKSDTTWYSKAMQYANNKKDKNNSSKPKDSNQYNKFIAMQYLDEPEKENNNTTTRSKADNNWYSKALNYADKNTHQKKFTVDTRAPIITINNSNFSKIKSSSINLNGLIKDDSSVSEVSVNGGLIEIDNSGQFNRAMYLGLGKNKFTIEAIDIFGNKASKTITVIRTKAIVKNKDKRLVPPMTMRNSNPNAVALIIGVDKYESITSAPWAESDAGSFYDYAQNVLGISADRIRLITGSDSSEAGIWKSVERWLPTMVDVNKSDVYLYFAGHGLASADGNNAYLIPWDGDPDLLDRTSILRSELIDGLKDLNAANVTLFMDTCYSGKARGGKGTLVADSRGLRIVKKDTLYNLPDNFTLFSAAANDETASSHPSLKHGLFSYWMMRGLDGDADSNNDRKITNGELHAFIDKNVQKNAVSMGRKQHPQLVGDKDKVITSW
jgi:hypothetical protein